jgi:pimeloyl-ACP methyl ester carboxylesterase
MPPSARSRSRCRKRTWSTFGGASRAARWPGKELVADRSQGGQLATLQNLVTYWGSDYDWRTCEAKLNALPQFETEIDDLAIHFTFVRSDHEDALPLVVTHGGRAEDAFHLVLPSLPGHGFSAAPTSVGWDPGRTARAWAKLMKAIRHGSTRRTGAVSLLIRGLQVRVLPS